MTIETRTSKTLSSRQILRSKRFFSRHDCRDHQRLSEQLAPTPPVICSFCFQKIKKTYVNLIANLLLSQEDNEERFGLMGDNSRSVNQELTEIAERQESLLYRLLKLENEEVFRAAQDEKKRKKAHYDKLEAQKSTQSTGSPQRHDDTKEDEETPHETRHEEAPTRGTDGVI